MTIHYSECYSLGTLLVVYENKVYIEQIVFISWKFPIKYRLINEFFLMLAGGVLPREKDLQTSLDYRALWMCV